MGSRQQGQEAGFQASNAHATETSAGQFTWETQTGSEQTHEYVSLRELELIPSPNQPIFTSSPFAIPRFAPMVTSTNSAGRGRQDGDELTQKNTNLTPATSISSPGGVSLGKLWGQPGVDLGNVAPTSQEREAYKQKRDGLARMATGPSCSVCGEPLTFEVLAGGSSCNVCGFI